jgi:large subunit ribosomal protein L14e
MALIEEGRVCIKKLGRDAGSKAVITKILDDNFVNIRSSVRPHERKCNVKHLEFISEKVSLSDQDQLAKALEIDKSKLTAQPKAQKSAQPKEQKPPKAAA